MLLVIEAELRPMSWAVVVAAATLLHCRAGADADFVQGGGGGNPEAAQLQQ